MRHDYPLPDHEGLVALRYYTPPENLAAYFGSAYLFTARKHYVCDHTRADFAQLRFMFEGIGHYRFSSGRVEKTAEICLLGPTLGATRFEVDGAIQLMGVALLPLGWLSLVGCDASEHADGLIDMGARGTDYRDLLAHLKAIENPEIAIADLWDFLRAHVHAVPPAMVSFVQAVDAWLVDENSPRVDRLVEMTDLSSRQVARLANRLYGAPPKYLARKYRALRCAAQIAVDHRNWQDLCEDGTFYDQSHFIREIKHFIGLTPHQLKTDASIVSRLTLQRRALEGDLAHISRIS